VRFPYFTVLASLVFLAVIVLAVVGRREPVRPVTPSKPVPVAPMPATTSIPVEPQATRADELKRRLTAALRVQAQYAQRYGDLTEARKALANMKLVFQGVDPLELTRGNFLRGYVSRVDDTLQSYSITVPVQYRPEKPTPLVISLHGHGWFDWWRPYQGHPAPQHIEGAIAVSPHGRGSMDFMFLGEVDVLECLEDVKFFYNIDPNRVYIYGFSMGGTGTWHMATHYPDLFAAAAPAAGNTDHTVWEKEWKWTGVEASPLKAMRDFARAQTSPITYAENMLNLPVLAEHGTADPIVPVGHTQNMMKRLAAIGNTQTEYHEFAGGHGGFTNVREDEWLLKKRRNPFPDRVLFKTDRLRYEGAYWVRIGGLSEPLQFGLVDARRTGKREFELKTTNLTSLRLVFSEPYVSPGEVKVWIDGQRIRTSWNGAPLSFARHGSMWFEGEETGIRKKKGLEGPIEDAFMDRFLVVYGTTAPSELERWIVREEAFDLNQQWIKRYLGPLRMKADIDVNFEDIRDSNLVLYGSPQANCVTAMVMHKLPIRIEGLKVIVGDETFEGADLGVKLCYPNPLNPEKYVVIFAGTTWRGIYQINGRFGNWFDWIPYDNRNWFDFGVFDDKTTIPETFLAVGYFDHQWQLDTRFMAHAYPEYREKVVPRRLPRYTRPPDLGALCLSDLLPLDIDFLKGTVGFDRSFEGNPLRIGSKEYEKGLGTKVDSSLTYALDGKFDTFEAEVGIDLEGAADVPPVRKSSERVRFRVLGDGRPLAEVGDVKWDSPPQKLVADISDVKRLVLVTEAHTGDRWQYGSAAWGNPTVRKASLEPEPTPGR